MLSLLREAGNPNEGFRTRDTRRAALNPGAHTRTLGIPKRSYWHSSLETLHLSHCPGGYFTSKNRSLLALQTGHSSGTEPTIVLPHTLHTYMGATGKSPPALTAASASE